MNARPWSVARYMVLVGLLVQIVGLGKFILVDIGLTEFIGELRMGAGGPIVAVPVVLLASLALLIPVIRGNRWGLLLTILVQALLTLTALPFFLDEFGKPGQGYSVWIITVTLTLAGLTAIAFGVVAVLEAFGRVGASAFRMAGGGLSRQGAVLGAAAFAWAGILALGYAVAQNPGGAVLSEIPEETAYLAAENTRYGPETLDLTAGKATAIYITNKDEFGHSFDIDALNVHVDVPGSSIVIAVVRPDAAGAIEFYCGVPGHKDNGMEGTINAN